MIPRRPLASAAEVTADEMAAVDRITIERYGVDLVRMMENAGRSLATLAVELFRPPSAIVLAGPGGNGGGGLVAARHLSNRGVDVRVVRSHPPGRLGEVPAEQLGILERLSVPVSVDPAPAAVVLDALVGYGLREAPRGRVGELVAWASAQAAPVVALDVPSGVDATTGEVHEPSVRARGTLTLALPKTGLSRAPEHVGRLFCADISVPPAAFAEVGAEVGDLFAAAPIVEIAPRGE